MNILHFNVNLSHYSRGEWQAPPVAEIIDRRGAIFWLRWKGHGLNDNEFGAVALVRVDNSLETVVEASPGLAWGFIAYRKDQPYLVVGDSSLWSSDELSSLRGGWVSEPT